uniref:Putative heparan-alpha-glucosaminide n-acetyltransferase-like protein n=1 Tax=Tabanus bromius TaxID=304241 RepID=A0A0K8TUB7_TABBR
MGSWIEYTQSKWRDLDMEKLTRDEAYLKVISNVDSPMWLYSLSADCYLCPFTQVKKIGPHETKHVKINVATKNSFEVYDRDVGTYAFNNETAYCKDIRSSLGEFGVYNMTIYPDKVCSIVTDKTPVNTLLPIVLIALLVIALVAFANAFVFMREKYFRTRRDPNEESDETVAPTTRRLSSLDTVRGIAIVLMIFVNGGGGGYHWIEHAPWNGLHFADIVFPFFMWIMGVCIPISTKSQLNRNIAKKSILYNILVRSIKLFLIGVFLNSVSGPNLETLRIMGVLQRFGICYFLAASVHTIFSKHHDILPQALVKRSLYDIFVMIPQWIFAWTLVVVHLVITFGLPVPGCPKGYLGPGGKHEMGAYNACIGGATGYIDDAILGNHIYQHPTAKYIYDSKAFDPEGIFGCLLSTVHVIIGVQCGMTLTTFTQWTSRVLRWSIWGLVLGLVGGALCQFSKEDGLIPVNKNLWSLSFVFVTSSLAFFLLVVCYYLIDVKSHWSGAPLRHCGMNAIIMYIGHSALHKMLPWHWRIGLMNTHFILLLECTWNTILWVFIAIYLHHKKIFYTV